MSPGRKPEPLARLDRGPGEDDAVHFLGLERLHRERDREVALAGAGRADDERDRVVADRVDVALLPGRLRSHGLATAHDLGGQDLARALVRLQHRDGPAESVAVELVALLEQHDHLLEQSTDAFGVGVVAGDRDLVAAHEDLHRERRFDETQQLVTLAEQPHHEVVSRNKDLERRTGVRRCQGRFRVARRSGRFRPTSAPPQTAPARQAELLEAGAELVDPASHHRREHAQVRTADRQHPAVEVLALELDAGREAREDLRVGIVEVVQAHEVDREARLHPGRAARIDEADLAFELPRQQLIGGHLVDLGQAQQARHRDRALARARTRRAPKP